MTLWNVSPLFFIAGLSMLYSREVAVRVGGALIALAGLVAAYDPFDADNYLLAVALSVGGFLFLAVWGPKWLHSLYRESVEEDE